MIVKESDIRAKIRRLLSEDSLTFYSPLGREEDFNITTPVFNGLDLDLSKDTSFDVIRLSKIVDAMTDPSFQNKIAWDTVAEGFLQNFGFTAPLGKQSPFFDVMTSSKHIGYSVKSSFASGATLASVINNSKINIDGIRMVTRNVSLPKQSSVILCLRSNNNQNNTFSIRWFACRKPVDTLDYIENLGGKILDRKSDYTPKHEPIGSLTALKNIFGDPDLFLEIIFKDYSAEEVQPYYQKIKIMNALKKASDEQLKDVFDYFLQKSLINEKDPV